MSSVNDIRNRGTITSRVPELSCTGDTAFASEPATRLDVEVWRRSAWSSCFVQPISSLGTGRRGPSLPAGQTLKAAGGFVLIDFEGEPARPLAERRRSPAEFVPARPEAMKAWIDFFAMEKALDEVEYEINNRPTWVHIPPGTRAHPEWSDETGGAVMRKRLMKDTPVSNEDWLNLENVAEVEISSEDPAHPIELALTGLGDGWRAAERGEQVVRLRFDEPRALRTIELKFDELHAARTQEFLLRWSADGGQTYRDIVRQQYTFSPPGTTSEAERFTVNLSGVTAIELRIIPDINHGPARASLSRFGVTEASSMP